MDAELYVKKIDIILARLPKNSFTLPFNPASLYNPPSLNFEHAATTCPGGEIGRHNGLKIRRFGKTGVPVRFRFRAPILDMTGFFIPWHIFAYFLILEILAAQCGMSF